MTYNLMTGMFFTGLAYGGICGFFGINSDDYFWYFVGVGLVAGLLFDQFQRRWR